MTKPALLTVDDDPQVLRAVARDLRRRYGKDYSVLRADSGASALEALSGLKERGDPVALVLSDHRMPEMQGVELLGKARELHGQAKRVLLTAYADTEAAIAAINESRLDFYLLKPWDPPEERLYPVLDDLLDDWRAGYRPGYGGVRVLGNRWSAESHEVKSFLARNHVPYHFLDIEVSDEARELVDDAGGHPEGGQVKHGALPLVILPDGTRLERPTVAELAHHLGLKTRAEQPFYDLAILGAGPAGLAAAVYGASEGLSTVLVEREAPGGQAGTTGRIENYLGFPAGLSGSDLARRGLTQARRFGVEVLSPQEAVGLRLDGPYKHLSLKDGSEITSHVLMIASGVSWRRLAAPGAEQLTGRGVYYGAALTEAAGCEGEDVYLVGAANSAGQAAVSFAAYARRVIMLVRGSSIEAKMSAYLVERLRDLGNVEVRLHTEVEACCGDDKLEALTLVDRERGRSERVPASSLFVFIGAAPRTDWLADAVARDDRGFILTGTDLESRHLADWPLERPPSLFEASVPGIFATGDVRHASVKRVASAVGEGSVAVHFIHRYLASL